MSPRRELSQAVQTRLNAGESKADIYGALKGTYGAATVERALAQWPPAEARLQNRQRNAPLIVIAVFFTLLKLLQISAIFQTLEAGQHLVFLPLAALPVIIYAYIIYGVKNYNLIGYLLLILMSIRNLLEVAHTDSFTSKPLMLAALSIAAIVLSLVQKRNLFPNTSWLLRHKKNADGTPFF